MCVKTLANYIEVTDTLMIIWENYSLCRHNLDLAGPYSQGEALGSPSGNSEKV